MREKHVAMAIILLGSILIFLTNPGEEKHKKAILSTVIEEVHEQTVSSESQWNQLSVSLSENLARKTVAEAVTLENFILFSMCKMDYQGNKIYLTLGLIGMVFVMENPNPEQLDQ